MPSDRPRPRHRPLRLVTQRTRTSADALAGLTVGDIMSTPVHTIEPYATLGDARARFQELGVHHLLVLDRGSVVAIVSDRDVLRRVSPFVGGISAQRRDEQTLSRLVAQAATYELVTVVSTALVQEAAVRLLDSGISALPVTDDEDRVVGIVTRSDLLRALVECQLAFDGRQPGGSALG